MPTPINTTPSREGDMEKNVKTQCQAIAGNWVYGTSRHRAFRAKPGTIYCTIHTYGYESPRSKRCAEKWQKEWSEREFRKKRELALIDIRRSDKTWLFHNSAE